MLGKKSKYPIPTVTKPMKELSFSKTIGVVESSIASIYSIGLPLFFLLTNAVSVATYGRL